MDTQPSRAPIVLLYLTACCQWFLIVPSSAAPCDSVPHEISGWGNKPQGWRLTSAECAEEGRHYYIQVGDEDIEDTEDTLSASLTFPVAGFRIADRTLKLSCDNSTIAEKGLSEYNLYITVRDACPTHSLQFQMKIEFTDIQAVTNLYDPRITPTTYDVFRDLYETDGETAVTSLFCTDDDNDEITTVSITNLAPFFIVPTSFASTFTLMLNGSLTLMPSQMRLGLEAVDNGTPPRTGTTMLTLNIREDTTTTTSTTITPPSTAAETVPPTAPPSTSSPTTITVGSPCDSVPHVLLNWNGKPPGWRLTSRECAEEDKHFYIQVGDNDKADTEDTLDASLTFPVAGFRIKPGTLKLYCDNSTIAEKGLREYNIYITVRDACPTHSLQFQMNIEFTDIPANSQVVPNLYDPRCSPTTVDVFRDLYETDGETGVVTLACTDEDNDEITAINIINLAPFYIVPTSFASTFTLMLNGSLTSMPSQMTLSLEAVDNGTPTRTGTTLLTLNIREDTTTAVPSTAPPSSNSPNTNTEELADEKTVGWIALLAGSAGVLLVILFVLTIVVVYARRRNKWCFTPQTDTKDVRRTHDTRQRYSTQETGVPSPPEAHVDVYDSVPVDPYNTIGSTRSEMFNSVGRASDYTGADVAFDDTYLNDVPVVHPRSNGDSVDPPRYLKERPYDNKRHSRPSIPQRY